MRLQQYILNERYVKIRYESVEVLENPSFRDMKSVSIELRFIAVDKTKTLYLWNSEIAIHNEIYERLRLGNALFSDIKNASVFVGVAKNKGSKYVVTSSDAIRVIKSFDQSYIDKWNWINEYIDINSFFEWYSTRGKFRL